jgi:hypothetical protein
MKVNKVDLRKVNFNKSATWNVWRQFGVDLDNYKGRKIVVYNHSMPQKEQNKLVNYMLDNFRKLKFYRHYFRSKKAIQRQISWEILGYFPKSTFNKKVRK